MVIFRTNIKDYIMQNRNFYTLKVFLFFALILPGTVFGQAKKRRLPAGVNLRSLQNQAPFISGDGGSIVYLTNYNDDYELSMRYARKKGTIAWEESEEVNRAANIPNLAYTGGFALNFDGSRLYITYKKGAGIGGYDIYYCDKKGNNWGEPKNFGRPLNSEKNDGSPSISADGKYMYFMRCDKMSVDNASGCKIFVAERKGRSWGEPKPLSNVINGYNAMSPRILADGETLVFASDRPGGKGGLDLYQSRKANGEWTEPVPMDFANTPGNDQFVSFTSKGRYIYHAVTEDKGMAIEQLIIPASLKPKKVMRVQGKIVDANTGEPLAAMVKAYSIATRDRVWSDATNNKGEFVVVLKEGESYDFSVEPKLPGYPYHSKLYYLEKMKYSDRDELNIKVSKISTGDVMELNSIEFEPYTAKLKDESTYELRRLTRLMKKMPGNSFEIEVKLNNYLSDSVQSDPDLTEVIIDTVYQEPTQPMEVEEADSEELEEGGEEYDQETDEVDTVSRESEEEVQEPSFTLKYTYHNDRTEKQAQTIKDYFTQKGVSEDKIKVMGKRVEGGNTNGDNDMKATMVKMKILK